VLALTVANPVAEGATARGEGGHGLVGMRERAALLGGTLDARSVGDRFEVRATLPRGPKA
jgi:signal transduction histidine kinase